MENFEISNISILSPIEDVLNFGDNYLYRKNVLENNQEELEVETYSNYFDVYAKVATFYINFFARYWYRDNSSMTTDRMIAEMKKVGINGWKGVTDAENNPLGEYVLTLDYPAKTTDIKEFFERVINGDLEFLNRYPIDHTNAFELIKSIYP